jgi:hypothetical protein
MTDGDGKIYAGDLGVKYKVDTKIDLTLATVCLIKVLDEATLIAATWTGAMAATCNTIIEYTSLDPAVAGNYKMISYVEFGALSKHSGKVAKFKIHALFT